VHIDARPSDSIAIALRLAAPIHAADALLVEPADADDEEDAEDDGDVPGVGGMEPELSSTDSSELSADQLKAYLENLRPEDFGKFNP
jgi:bifunctional DNase/RNase